MRDVLLQLETEREREGPTEKREGCVMGYCFVLGLRIEDNMTDSPDNHISPPHMVWIWGIPDCVDG